MFFNALRFHFYGSLDIDDRDLDQSGTPSTNGGGVPMDWTWKNRKWTTDPDDTH